VRYCEALFRWQLGGARLLTNRSIWRSFPVVRNVHHEARVPTLAIEPASADDANTALAAERADLCVIG